MIFSDWMIKDLVEREKMIDPFFNVTQGRADGKISWGLSSCGYDARLDTEFKIPIKYKNDWGHQNILDPKFLDLDRLFKNHRADSLIIQAGEMVLARTMEYFKLPRDVFAICLGKSTYARCGLIVNVTPIEPEWEGHVTLELSNTSSLPIRVYGGEGICQFIFYNASRPEVSYADKQGKYQGQIDVTIGKV